MDGRMDRQMDGCSHISNSEEQKVRNLRYEDVVRRAVINVCMHAVMRLFQVSGCRERTAAANQR